MKKQNLLLTLVAIVAVMALAGSTGNCASTTLPPALTSSQQAVVRHLRFPATVGVEPFEAPVYSDALTKVLRDSELFLTVRSLAAFRTPPDLVARIERPIFGTATIPLVTAISLGFIPTTVQEEHGCSFSLASGARPSGDRVPVDFSYTGPSTLGWYSLFLNLTPNRTSRDIDSHRRFREGLAWAVAEQRAQILFLLRKGAA